MAMRPKSVADWTPPQPSARPELLKPNAKDNPDSLTPQNPHKQTLGGSGKPQGPFGKKAREF